MPQAVFRVRAVARCTSTLPGHAEAILSTSFSADGSLLATGSGDHTVRLWDSNTELPKATLKAHKDHVLSASLHRLVHVRSLYLLSVTGACRSS